MKNTRSQLADHVTQLGVANKMVSVLQEQLVVSRKEQAEMKNELVQLREKNNMLRDSLRNMQQVFLISIGYSVIVALTGLPIGYSVIVALTGLP